jgi:hypothetical protein
LLCLQYVASGRSRRMEHWPTDCRLRKVSNAVTVLSMHKHTHTHTEFSISFVCCFYAVNHAFIDLVVFSRDRSKTSSKVSSPHSAIYSFLLQIRVSSSISFLHLLPHLPVTFIPPFIFPSVTSRRRQFICKM